MPPCAHLMPAVNQSPCLQDKKKYSRPHARLLATNLPPPPPPSAPMPINLYPPPCISTPLPGMHQDASPAAMKPAVISFLQSTSSISGVCLSTSSMRSTLAPGISKVGLHKVSGISTSGSGKRKGTKEGNRSRFTWDDKHAPHALRDQVGDEHVRAGVLHLAVRSHGGGDRALEALHGVGGSGALRARGVTVIGSGNVLGAASGVCGALRASFGAATGPCVIRHSHICFPTVGQPERACHLRRGPGIQVARL